MAITPVSLVNSVSYQSAEAKKVSNLVTFNQPQETEKSSEAGALKSYFMGGLAATVSFGGFPVSTGGFITKKIDDVPCSCCGGRMVRNPEMDKKAREFAGINGEKLAEKIEADKDFFRTPQRVVMMLVAQEAKTHPNYDLARAKSACGKGLKEKTQAYCINSLKQADEVVKAAYGEDNATSKLLNKEIEKLQNGNIGRMALTEELVKQQASLSPEIYETVLDAAMNIPMDFNEVKKAFGDASGSSQNIAKSLLRPSMQTIEHIHPKSLGGPNATQNFVAECADCNNPRGNMSYSQWLKIHPEFPLKAQDHIEWFQQQVVNGRIDSRYDDYGVDVKQTLSKESKGIIELKVLNPEKIQELREAKKANEDVSVKDEIAAQDKEKDENEE
ncbi:MAG: HNH endonuclease [Candidatus Gastranaerophilales bacterium]|nr:HNH endonuclease [Candidatus Gastranaerophilales bacterium]